MKLLKNLFLPHSVVLFLLIFLIFKLSVRIHSNFQFPFPPFNQSVFDLSNEFKKTISLERPLGSHAGYRDVGGILMGLRRLTADIAWIGILQYYGSHQFEETEEDNANKHEHQHSDFGGGDYPALKKMIQRVIRLDPSFYYAYLVGGGALVWNLNRPEEGMEIFIEGIQRNPTYWKFRLYAGAVIYKQKGKFEEMIKLLEDAVRYPDCPTMIKSILANIYKDRKNFKRALEIWIDVFENEKTDPWYKYQAGKKIAELRGKLGI